jgi:hypothetical protein
MILDLLSLEGIKSKITTMGAITTEMCRSRGRVLLAGGAPAIRTD